MSQTNADRNLLLGILAYQNAFVTRDALLAAMQAWLYDKAKSLAEILREQGALDAESRQLLDALVDKHLKQHDGDPAKSLAAVSAVDSVRGELEALPDADLQASIVHLRAARGKEGDYEPERTRSFAGNRHRQGHAFAGFGRMPRAVWARCLSPSIPSSTARLL
jgi:eukaryotic-like serine/threonine-protein kinase